MRRGRGCAAEEAGLADPNRANPATGKPLKMRLGYAEARRFRESVLPGDGAPYLAVHIRRGADRLHDFCHTGWGKRCFGWNITMAMCVVKYLTPTGGFREYLEGRNIRQSRGLGLTGRRNRQRPAFCPLPNNAIRQRS